MSWTTFTKTLLKTSATSTFLVTILCLKSTNETFVSKVIDKFNVKKATGVDKIFVCQIDETW
jgi:nitrogen regulatory protein PII